MLTEDVRLLVQPQQTLYSQKENSRNVSIIPLIPWAPNPTGWLRGSPHGHWVHHGRGSCTEGTHCDNPPNSVGCYVIQPSPPQTVLRSGYLSELEVTDLTSLHARHHIDTCKVCSRHLPTASCNETYQDLEALHLQWTDIFWWPIHDMTRLCTSNKTTQSAK